MTLKNFNGMRKYKILLSKTAWHNTEYIIVSFLYVWEIFRKEAFQKVNIYHNPWGLKLLMIFLFIFFQNFLRL